VRNIDSILKCETSFATLEDFWRPTGLGPAVILFTPEENEFIYTEWEQEGFPLKLKRGDQAWIESRRGGMMKESIDILQELFPGEFF
jgi:hypothetical protein